MATDAKTLPPALQPVALVALVAFAIWHLAAFHFALRDEGHVSLWWVNWQMFTTLDDTTEIVEAEAYYDGAWHAFELQELFPFEWESGPRYARNGFYESPGRMKVLGAATCRRFPRPIEKVRFDEVKWRRKFGTVARPPNAKREALLEWKCGAAPVKLPLGRSL